MININEIFLNEEFLKLINIKDGKIESIKEIEEIKQNLEIDEIYFIDKTKYNNITHINKYIKLLYHLYYHYKEFKNKKNCQFTRLEKCYIISKKYMDKIKDIFKYDEFCKGIEDNKIKDIINKFKELYKNETNNVNNLINYDEFYLEFKNNFSIKFLECILSINNEKDLNNKDLIKLNKYQLKVNEKGEDKYLSYYSNFEIISEKLEENKTINHFIINKKKEKAEFLISNNKLILYPSLNNESILIIEDINNNNELIPELLIHFEDSTKLKAFIEQIKKNGYNNLISELNFIQQKASIINNETKNLDGKAYQINIKDNKENKEEISLLKGTIIPNEEKIQQKVGNEENNEKDVIEYINIEKGKLTSNDNQTNEIKNNTLFSHNNIDISSQNKKKTLLESMERDIKTLIKYFIFNRELKRIIELTKNENNIIYKDIFKCYFINIKWIKEFMNLYLYKKLINYLNQELKIITPLNNNLFNYDENFINYIYGKIPIELFNEFKKIMNDIPEKLDDENFEIESITINNNNLNDIISYPINFGIVDQDIYNNLIKRKNKILKNKYTENSFIINNQKILIKINNSLISEKKNLYIIKGDLLNENENNYNYFKYEMLLDFECEGKRIKIFEFFQKSNSFGILNEGNKFIKSIYKCDNNNQLNKIKVNNNINNDNNYLNEYNEMNKILKFFIVLNILYFTN